jgi:hypothetical protein
MKKIIIALSIAAWSLGTFTVAQAEAVTKKVCHEDAKTKKQVCKTIKTHKKVEGTPVPEAPAKKSKSKSKK